MGALSPAVRRAAVLSRRATAAIADLSSRSARRDPWTDRDPWAAEGARRVRRLLDGTARTVRALDRAVQTLPGFGARRSQLRSGDGPRRHRGHCGPGADATRRRASADGAMACCAA